jgi:large subunit ribosomal protein L32e
MNPRKKPKFIRHMSQAYRRVKPSWRKPRGIHSKVRTGEKGKIMMPSIGWGAPAKLKGLHPSGLKEVLVCSIKDLEKVDASKEGIKIAHTVGKKKRTEILKKAEEMKIKVLNP